MNYKKGRDRLSTLLSRPFRSTRLERMACETRNERDDTQNRPNTKETKVLTVNNRRGAIMLEYVLIGLVAITIFAVVAGALGGSDGLFANLIGRFSDLVDGVDLN